jgi:DNA-binding NarL/FixJ family response regulator
MTCTRILIADDHEVARCGLRRILEDHANWEVVAEAADGKEAVLKSIETKPDIAILDYSLPLLNGIEAARQIRAQLPGTEVLIFTMNDSETVVQQAFRARAQGYLLKSDANNYLVEAIESLALHKPFFTPGISESLLLTCAAKPDKDSAITRRERTIVQLVAEGHSNKAIANSLKIALKTVETHRASAMRKLELSSTAALVRYAIRNHLVEA